MASHDRLIQIQTALIGLATTVLLCGIPWAYVMHGDVRELKVQSQYANEKQREMAADLKMMNTTGTRLEALEKWRETIDRMIQGGAAKARQGNQ